jgi:uncharacterized membrane protein YgcG
MSQVLGDSRNRPVVFETHAEPTVRRMRSPVRLLAGGTLVLAALTGAVGLAFGGSAVWSIVGPQVPNNAPAPLWIAPPRAITPVRTDDGHTTSDLDHSKPKPTTPTTATHGRDDATTGNTHDLNDPDRPATVNHASTATKAAPATHEPAATENDENRKGAGGSGGTSTGGSADTSSGGGSAGGSGKSGR